MTKYIGLAAALVAATGVILATPGSSDACSWGHGCYYARPCYYSSPVLFCGRTNYCCYSPVVPCCSSTYYGIVVAGSSYSYHPQVIASTTPAPTTLGVTSQPASDNTVQIRVVVPASAKVWFNDSVTSQVGTDRLFTSPSLAPGIDYNYEIKAQWLDQSGKEVTQVRQVNFRTNAQVEVNFTQPAP